MLGARVKLNQVPEIAPYNKQDDEILHQQPFLTLSYVSKQYPSIITYQTAIDKHKMF